MLICYGPRPMSPRQGASPRSAANRLLDRIEHRKAKLGVIGLGYVGLPLAVEFGHAGYSVHGFDIDTKRTVLANVRRVLRHGGHLLLGGAESTVNLDAAFQRTELGRAVVFRHTGGAA